MRTLSILLLFYLAVPALSSAQQKVKIEGYVRDTLGQPIEMVNVLLQKNNAVLLFTVSDANGYFLLESPADSSSYELVAALLGYEEQIKKIQIDQSRRIDFALKELTLEEVQISASGIIERGDTTIYQVDRLIDGTERTVEDLLRKLPGVSVNSEGKIQFKGREIEEVLIDNERLIGRNYTLATRNLSIDLVEEIRALENFSENPLLKGIENSNKVVLDLRIKEERKSLFFGSIDAGYAPEAFRDVTGNLFSYSKKLKIYAVGNHNNIAKSSQVRLLQAGEVQEANFGEFSIAGRNQALIAPTQLNTLLGWQRTRLNHESNAALNTLYTFGPKLKVRNQLYFLSDVQKQTWERSNEINNANLNFRTSEQKSLALRPLFGKARVESEWRINDSLLFTHKSIVEMSQLQNPNSVFFDNGFVQENINQNLHNQNIAQWHNIELTHRLSAKRVWQGEAAWYQAFHEQGLEIRSDTNRLADFFGQDALYKIALQQAQRSTSQAKLQGSYLTRHGAWRSELRAGALWQRQSFESALGLSSEEGAALALDNFSNLLHLQAQQAFGSFLLEREFLNGRLKLRSKLALQYNKLQFEQAAQVQSTEGLFVLPELSASFRIGRHGFITDYGWQQQFSDLQQLYAFGLLKNYQSIEIGLPLWLRTRSTRLNISHVFAHLQESFTWFNTYTFLSNAPAYSTSLLLDNNFSISQPLFIEQSNIQI